MLQLYRELMPHLAGAVRLFVTTSMILGATTVAAQVSLSNSVQKVEEYVDEQGMPQRRLVDADSVVPGDELRYTIAFVNTGTEPVDAGSIVITNPVPESTEYLADTAFGAGTEISYSADGGRTFGAPDTLREGLDGASRLIPAAQYTTIRWVFQPVLEPGGKGHVSFNVRLK
jgi:uncharacterized repeat protein (TIGR01451 family)